MYSAGLVSAFFLGCCALQPASALSPVSLTLRRHGVRGSYDNATQIYCHNATDAPIYTAGDPDNGGPGILLTNNDNSISTYGSLNGTTYVVYESDMDWSPYKFTIIPSWGSIYISVCPTFRGRIVRGAPINLDGQKHNLGTWAEINMNTNGTGWGDISLLQGCDGPAMIQSLDGRNEIKGFDIDILTNAPAGAWAQKSTGSWCLAKIVGSDGNNVTKNWEEQFLSPWTVFLEDDINPVINSNNGRFLVTFYQGVI